jgi:multidrug resistance efflux pump
MIEPAHNGSTSPAPLALSERVRSLRLPHMNAALSGGASRWLPWAICGLLLFATSLLAVEAFAPISDDLLKKLAEERGLNLGTDNLSSSALSMAGASAPTASKSEIALESKGYIVPFSLIQVSPIISGTVLQLYIEEGKKVEKGFVLAELDPTEFKADYDKAVAGIKSAEGRMDELWRHRKDEIQQALADLNEAKAQLALARAKFDYAKSLQGRAAISREDYVTAESNFLATQARVDRLDIAYRFMIAGPRDDKIATAKADLAQAKADFDKAKWRLDNTRVKAPITGIILSKKTEAGNIVNPSAFSNGLSASLCEMANLFEMEVDLSIAERDIAKVFEKQDCRVRAEAYPNRTYPGKVSRIMPMADRSKGSVPVRVVIKFASVDAKGQALAPEEQGQYLRPEMGAIVTFLNRQAEW